MINGRRGETAEQIKARAMQTQTGDHFYLHLPDNMTAQSRSRDCAPCRRTGDAETTTQVGVLPPPKDGSHYILQDLADGSVEIVLVNTESEFTGNLPASSGDRAPTNIHKLYAVDGDPQLRRMNKANKDFWQNRK